MHRGGMWFSNCLWQPSCINSGGRGLGRIFQFKSTSVDGLLLGLRLIYDPVYVLGGRNVKKTD